MNSTEGDGFEDEYEETSKSKKKKRNHRHSAEQIEQLEAFFKKFPHPEEKQRRQLSRELGLEPRQIKFWFQNKRTQMKAQNERANNNALRIENEKLRCRNFAMREALKYLKCPRCDCTISKEEEARQQNLRNLWAQNALLNQQHERLSNVESAFLERSGAHFQFGMPNFPEDKFFG